MTFLLAVLLSWCGVTDAQPPVQGYKIYYGPISQQQTEFRDVGNVTSAEVTGLPQGIRTYIVVRAYNSAGESGSSNEVSWTEPVPSPTPVPASDYIRFFPRAGYEARMAGGKFQGANSISGPWTDLYTIPNIWPGAKWYQANANLGNFQYLRYLAPNPSYGSVAEVEFYRAGVKVQGTLFGTPGSYNNSGNVIQKAVDGDTSTFWDAPTAASGNHFGYDRGQDRNLPGYTLVFSDEFDTRSIGDHRNKGANTWGDYPPYGAAAAFSFSHWMGSYQARKDFAIANSGIMELWTRRVELDDPNGRNWVSGVIASRDIRNSGFAQNFGYWSARIKMPDAFNSAWCAFWLASTSGIPSAGSKGYELDIMEWYGRGSRVAVDHVVHPWNANGSQAPQPYEGGITVPIPGGTFNQFHVYGCEVNPTNIIFYIDGVETFRKPTNPDYIKDPLYIILNYALQGAPTGEPFASKGDSKMEIDWVHAYSLPQSATPPAPPSAPGSITIK